MVDSTSEFEHPADDVHGWVEQDSSVMFNPVTRAGDPVELTAEEAPKVAAALVRLAERFEAAP